MTFSKSVSDFQFETENLALYSITVNETDIKSQGFIKGIFRGRDECFT